MTTSKKQGTKGRGGVEGILGGLGDILGRISELAERSEAFHREGRLDSSDATRGRFHIGFNIRTMADAAGEQSIEVEPFGHVSRDPASGEASVSECREPPTDIFEETDCIVVIVEMPGIGEEDATFAIDGDLLTITAEREAKRYRKEVLLSRSFPQGAMSVSAVNGVFEIKLSIHESEAA